MEIDKKYSIKQYIRDVARYIRPYSVQFLIGIFLRFTSDVSRLYPAWALSRIIVLLTNSGSADNLNELLTIFVLWGLAYAYFGLTHNLSKYFGYQVAEKASLDIYRETLAHVFTLDFSWQEQENSGNKIKRIDKGLDGINLTIRRIFDVLISVVVNTVGIVFIFSGLDPLLTVSLIVFMVTYYVFSTLLLRRSMKQEKLVNKAFENLSGVTFEALNNIQTIKSLSIDRGVNASVALQIQELIKKIKKRIYFYQSQGALQVIYQSVYFYIVVSWLAWNIFHGTKDVGLLVLFFGLFNKVSSSTEELTDVTQQLALAKIWISRAMDIRNTQSEIENPEKVALQQTYPPDWKEVRIEQVGFGYGKKNALHQISLTIRRGEKIGIVGLSGAGKSTLFKLLLDLYEDYDGHIFIDNIPLKDIWRQSYIDHVAVVLQDTELFDMSLKDNIQIAGVQGDSRRINLADVIRMAHLDSVVEQLDKGVDTIVGEKGIKLSGGQRQRVGIARALYRQPDILLLDEATSHLDAHSEKEIQQALQENLHKFTTIVIAHRLSTIMKMDRIVVLSKGKIVEQGSFQELLNNQGAFSKMWKEQKI
ncbi:ABC transporter ATP-binding protein [Candidatus Woesebacteria bacterium]|nr:ABC transporter ATP-binding protein [Candidatus Woesebacteria bacterium]